MSFDWTKEATEAAVRQWNDGLSAGLIAQRMGLTRNAVLGKLHRMARNKQISMRRREPGEKPIRRKNYPAKPKPLAATPLELPPVRIGRPAPPPRFAPGLAARPRAKLKPAAVVEAVVEAEAETEPAVAPEALVGPEPFLGISILELNERTCRWPRGGPPWSFCGQGVDEGSIYCRGHRARAVQGGLR